MKIRKVLASSVARLDSSVDTGGGTDDTAALQAVLDEAKDENCGVWLVMDGAALITGLDVYSDTTIECLSRSCGFYQRDNADRAVIAGAEWDFGARKTRNVTLIGGTYNQNCLRQVHDRPARDEKEKMWFPGGKWIFGIEFYGVEYLTIRDLTLRDFRTFGVTIGNFKHVDIENVWLDLPDHMDGNQDGFHFWGPGQFLNVKNVGGTVGDDFMNLGPDERDGCSDITDVLVDGVMLEHADQAIRLLSWGTGVLDRVTIRNVTGTYTTFGFYINSWDCPRRPLTYGDFRNILIENVDLRAETPVYDYHQPFLFSVGGNIECLTVKNLRHHDPADPRPLFELGLPYADTECKLPADNYPKFRNLIVDGLTILENSASAKKADYIQIFERVDHLALRNVYVSRDPSTPPDGHLIAFRKDGALGMLDMNDVRADGFLSLVDGEERIDRVCAVNVTAE